MSNLQVDSDIIAVLKKLQDEGETMQDVLKRLLYKELKNLTELPRLETFDDEDWDKATKSILIQFDDVLHELAK